MTFIPLDTVFLRELGRIPFLFIVSKSQVCVVAYSPLRD